MSFGVSIGDFITVGTLLATTTQKCQAASKEFQDLSQVLQTTRLCIDSSRNTLQGVFDQLPIMHQNAIASSLIGLKNLVVDLNSELDRYAAIAPGRFQLVKLQFALLADPRTAESKLTLHLSMLNTCMALIICDSMTRSTLPPYEITDLIGNPDSQTASQLNQQGKHAPKHSVAEQWIASAGSNTFAARGIYTYDATAIPEKNLPQTDRVDFRLCVSGNRINGTCMDSVGSATVNGQIDLQRNAIRFIKQYLHPVQRLTWEYEGCFTSCGITGEWHTPGDPPAMRYIRGRFAIWLQNDEAARGSDLEEQLRLLENKGAILTRSLSFRRF